MPLIEGTRSVKSVTAEFDFAKDGGTTGTKTLRGSAGWDNSVPAGSFVTSGYIEVLTALAGSSAVAKLQIEGAADITAGTDLTGWTTGRKDILAAGTGSTSIKTTVTRNIKLVVSGAALTAGKFRVTLFFV